MLDVMEFVFYRSQFASSLRKGINILLWLLKTSYIRVFTEDRTDSSIAFNILSCICIISLKVAIDTNSAVAGHVDCFSASFGNGQR